MRILSRADVEALLGYRQCMDAIRVAMIHTSRRDCVLPLRQFMPIPGRPGKLGLMPGYLGGDADCFGVKIVSKYERPAGDPYGSHVGGLMLFEAATGLPLALLEGGALTAIRTASMTAVATDALARDDAENLLIVGAGEEAWHHARALPYARAFAQVSVWARDVARAEKLVARLAATADDQVGVRKPQWRVAENLAKSFSTADVVCTVTSAKSPVINGEWCRPGQHINLVGSAIAQTAEVDDLTVRRSEFFVDYRDAALAAAGELLGAISRGAVTESHLRGEIGEVLTGTIRGRTHQDQITVYKSLGVLTQDLAAAQLVLREAERRQIGHVVDMMS